MNHCHMSCVGCAKSAAESQFSQPLGHVDFAGSHLSLVASLGLIALICLVTLLEFMDASPHVSLWAVLASLALASVGVAVAGWKSARKACE